MTPKRRCKVDVAVRVNGDGPYCFLCLYLAMARRHAEARGLTLLTAVQQGFGREHATNPESPR
jgi:hypothetical protein